jgi:hypothetical protein
MEPDLEELRMPAKEPLALLVADLAAIAFGLCAAAAAAMMLLGS